MIVLFSLGLTHPAATAQEHLEPERGSLNEGEMSLDFARLYVRTLLKDEGVPIQYRARVICFPWGAPAWVVTLVREGGETPAYFLDYAGFDEAPPGTPLDKARVKRVRAPIDRETAEAVQEVLLRMLRAVRHPKTVSLVADGVDYHFSRFVSHATGDPLAPSGWESGKIWSPKPNSPTGLLAAIAESLRHYATETDEGRVQARAEILRKVEALRAALR